MKIVGCQLDIVWEDKSANHANVSQLLAQAVPEAGSLVILPEMFATGFSMRAQALSDSATLETQRFLAETAQRYGIYLAAGIITDGGAGRGRNECVVYGPDGQEVARYAKLQPFTLGGEARHYEAGNQVCLFDWAGFKVAPFICYDLRFPELFRAAAQQGANLILVIASWPETRISHWDALLKARAIENQAYVVGVNRCGQDPTLRYNGHSQVLAPSGEVLAEAGAQAGLLHADLDLDGLQVYRQTLPFLADARQLRIASINEHL